MTLCRGKADGRGPRRRAERLRAGRAECEDLRERARGRPGHRRRQEIAGRKRHLRVDTLGLLPTVWVTVVSVSGNADGMHLMRPRRQWIQGHSLISRRLALEFHPELARHLNLGPNSLTGMKRSLGVCGWVCGW